MADNVSITSGSGTVIAADEIGGVQYQRVKISLGADGAAADLAPGQGLMAASVPVAIASNQSTLDVTVTSPDTVITVTPTLDTSAYASGDLLFDSTAIANAVRANGGTAVLQSITMIDKADQKVALTLLFANANTDFGTLNSAPNPDDAETATVIGHIPIAISDYVDLGGAAVACIRGVGLLLKADAAATTIYVAAVNGTGTPTYVDGDLVLQIGLLRS